MISTRTDGIHGSDLEHYLQAASQAFYAIQSIPMGQECFHFTTYFDVMFTPVACSAGGHRKIFRKLVRAIAGAPGGLD